MNNEESVLARKEPKRASIGQMTSTAALTRLSVVAPKHTETLQIGSFDHLPADLVRQIENWVMEFEPTRSALQKSAPWKTATLYFSGLALGGWQLWEHASATWIGTAALLSAMVTGSFSAWWITEKKRWALVYGRYRYLSDDVSWKVRLSICGQVWRHRRSWSHYAALKAARGEAVQTELQEGFLRQLAADTEPESVDENER